MSTVHWTILSDIANSRHKFNPSDKNDLKEFSYFKKNGKWRGTCPFYLEWPFQDVSTMCNAKYADYMLKSLKK
jgi:hypothetical protein